MFKPKPPNLGPRWDKLAEERGLLEQPEGSARLRGRGRAAITRTLPAPPQFTEAEIQQLQEIVRIDSVHFSRSPLPTSLITGIDSAEGTITFDDTLPVNGMCANPACDICYPDTCCNPGETQ